MTRGTLHQLVEDLDEQDLPTARRVLGALCDSRRGPGPVGALEVAPGDDEPETPEECVARGSREPFEAVLGKVPDVEPEERDRLD